jgi:hypothetical protein
MRYEETITLYGTIVVNAKNKKEAEKKIDEIIDKIKESNLLGENLIIGEVDKEGTIVKMK